MKESLSHLPSRKRYELSRVVDVICAKAPQAEMIILFGSYARGDWVEDIYVKDHVTYEYMSDFDILVIVKTAKTANMTNLWHGVEKTIRSLGNQTWTTLIIHDIDFVNRKLSRGQYFFTDIKKEGVSLYDSKNFKLARRRKLDPQERAEIAKEDFKNWFKSANGFYDGYEFYVEKRSHKLAAFSLHQATEHSYAAVLLVFTGYKPKTHDLETLSHMAAGHDPAFLPVFPQSTPGEKRRFKLLRDAYVKARYDKNYKITRGELKYLAERVQKLQRITRRICKKKIGSFV